MIEALREWYGFDGQARRRQDGQSRYMLRQAGITGANEDLLVLVTELRWQLSDYFRNTDSYDDYYLVAGSVSDEVTEEEALAIVTENAGLNPVDPIGGMDENVTAVHELLLTLADQQIERWVKAEESEVA